MEREDYKEPPTKWEKTASHAGTGRTAFQRTVDFRNTGNNEGDMTIEVQVKESTGELIAESSMYIKWEYHGGVRVEFAEDGQSVNLTGSDGDIEKVSLLDLPSEKT